MRFEWDPEKNEINMRKHGISFPYATRVFDDEDRLEVFDEEHSDDEDRYDVIGRVDDVLFVVYTERPDDIIRIIRQDLPRRKRGACIMAMVTFTKSEIDKYLTKERVAAQVKELKRRRDMPIEFDDDCPEMTDEQLARFKRVRPKHKHA